MTEPRLPASPASENAELRERLLQAKTDRRVAQKRWVVVGAAVAFLAAGAFHGMKTSSRCPDGAEMFGGPPPDGTLAYCRLVDGDEETRHGLYVEWYADRGSWQSGQKVPTRRLQGLYERDVREGVWRRWRHSGQLRELMTYKGGKLHGPFERFDKEGNKTVAGENVDGLHHGPYTAYYPDGNTKNQGHYLRAKRDGVWRSFWGNGVTRRIERFDEGVPVGAFESRFAGGELEASGAFKDGAQDGDWVRYRRPNVLQFKQAYANGLPHGVWADFDNDGNKVREEIWKDGALDGVVREWFASGDVSLEGRYVEGFPAGEWRYYSVSGEVNVVDHGEPSDDEQIAAR